MRFQSQKFSITIKVFALILPLIALIFISSVYGKDFWEKGDYKTWSKKDCSKMLADSPWAKKVEETTVDVNSADPTSSDGRTPFIKYQVQLRSAAPIRQAIIRQTQIANKYDELSPEQQQALDKQTDAFLNANYDDFVVVYVTYETNNRNFAQDLASHWQTQSTERLKTSVYLNGSKGDKIPVSQFIAGGGAERSFQFIFPRKQNGKEILGPEDKSLILEFPYPAIGRLGGGRAFLEFNQKKLEYNGKVEY
jgi:hypothetical protein